MSIATHPVRRVTEGLPMPRDQWPATIPAVAQVLDEGLDLEPGVTFLVGENAAGKSTLLEAIAIAAGLPAEGGNRQLDEHSWVTESALSEHLQLARGLHSSEGFFLRAETMHGYFTRLAERGSPRGAQLHARSHGESFLDLSHQSMRRRGFYCLDEPESALSYTSTLALVARLAELARDGSQILCATHSPILCALPGATILELTDAGIAPCPWEDLALVQSWRAFFTDPGRQLHHVLGLENL